MKMMVRAHRPTAHLRLDMLLRFMALLQTERSTGETHVHV